MRESFTSLLALPVVGFLHYREVAMEVLRELRPKEEEK